MKIAILGKKQTILGFKALGVKTFGIENKDDLTEAKQQIKQGDFAVLLITENIAKQYCREMASFYSQALPAVLKVPGVSGSSETGRQDLKEILERALGSDILN